MGSTENDLLGGQPTGPDGGSVPPVGASAGGRRRRPWMSREILIRAIVDSFIKLTRGWRSRTRSCSWSS